MLSRINPSSLLSPADSKVQAIKAHYTTVCPLTASRILADFSPKQESTLLTANLCFRQFFSQSQASSQTWLHRGGTRHENKKNTKELLAGSLVASGADAMFDAVLSFSVLVSAIIFLTTGLSLEAYVGAVISGFIIKSGIDMKRRTYETMSAKRYLPTNGRSSSTASIWMPKAGK